MHTRLTCYTRMSETDASDAATPASYTPTVSYTASPSAYLDSPAGALDASPRAGSVSPFAPSRTESYECAGGDVASSGDELGSPPAEPRMTSAEVPGEIPPEPRASCAEVLGSNPPEPRVTRAAMRQRTAAVQTPPKAARKTAKATARKTAKATQARAKKSAGAARKPSKAAQAEDRDLSEAVPASDEEPSAAVPVKIPLGLSRYRKRMMDPERARVMKEKRMRHWESIRTDPEKYERALEQRRAYYYRSKYADDVFVVEPKDPHLRLANKKARIEMRRIGASTLRAWSDAGIAMGVQPWTLESLVYATETLEMRRVVNAMLSADRYTSMLQSASAGMAKRQKKAAK